MGDTEKEKTHYVMSSADCFKIRFFFGAGDLLSKFSTTEVHS